MTKQKAPPKRSDKQQITFRLPEEMVERLRVGANQRGISVNAYILILIDEELTRRQE